MLPAGTSATVCEWFEGREKKFQLGHSCLPLMRAVLYSVFLAILGANSTVFNALHCRGVEVMMSALKLPGMKKMSASERLVVRVYTFFDSFFFKKPELKLWSKTFFCARVCLWFFNLQNHCMVLLYFVHHL
jgi:hypothetical protein